MQLFMCLSLVLAVSQAATVKRGIHHDSIDFGAGDEHGGDFGGFGGDFGGGLEHGHDSGLEHKGIEHGKGATSYQNVHLESYGGKAIAVPHSEHHGLESFGGGHEGLESHGSFEGLESHGGLEGHGLESHGSFEGGLESHGSGLESHGSGLESHGHHGGFESFGHHALSDDSHGGLESHEGGFGGHESFGSSHSFE